MGGQGGICGVWLLRYCFVEFGSSFELGTEAKVHYALTDSCVNVRDGIWERHDTFD